MNFIGIDLAWTRKNESGICVISDGGDILFHKAHVFNDEEIVDIVMKFSSEGSIVGIDAPLIINNEGGSRRAEGLVMRDRIHGRRLSLFNSNRNYMMKVFKCIRGEDISKAICKRDERFHITWKFNEDKSDTRLVYETFPTGIALGLFPEADVLKYKLKNKIPIETTRENMKRMIHRLKGIRIEGNGIENIEGLFHTEEDISRMNRKKLKNLEDKVDAFLCAFGGYFYYRNEESTRIYGDEEDGFIVIPVRESL